MSKAKQQFIDKKLSEGCTPDKAERLWKLSPEYQNEFDNRRLNVRTGDPEEPVPNISERAWDDFHFSDTSF